MGKRFRSHRWAAVSLTCALLALSGCENAKGLDNAAPTSTPPALTTPPAAGQTPGSKPADTGSVSSLPYTKEVVATKLNVPWDMDFAPDGRIFLTERSGTIRVIDKGKLLDEPLYRFEPPMQSKGEGGLLGIAVDKDFKNNHYMYVYYTYQEGGKTLNRVVRMVESGNKAKPDKVLLDDLPGASNHDGGRIKLGPDGLLYITAGDAAQPLMAQDLKQPAAKYCASARTVRSRRTIRSPVRRCTAWATAIRKGWRGIRTQASCTARSMGKPPMTK